MAVVTELLAPLRAHGKARTSGLADETILDFAGRDPQLGEAIAAAAVEYERVRAEFPELLDLDEDAQTVEVQSGFVNFYSHDAANPYVALAARGPWLVTLKGAVLYDTGGYGMLGFGLFSYLPGCWRWLVVRGSQSRFFSVSPG